ncbi:ABC transporter ATP-binding protein [Roseateles oligotrophus]|uniref:ABC transporter ATP-binding protein n=1 Tax=Roseateles oligotrophus TaxID=1769250 RepID=A0ABT2YIV7_9BURK|nr:ABC transporter ATP-binding protein [Roseateles oligotrophus]MCV2370001.1 ABC transporter ATP-binding protein [Roseateles oligotrophus]
MFLALDQIGLRYPGAAQPHLQPHASAAAGPRRGAVEALSLNLAKGQIGVLIGPSGCGKTSVLRCIAGLERLHSGRISIAGELLADANQGLHLNPEERRIGMVFQDYALFPHLSVADNIGFGLRHLSRPTRTARINEMLDLVGLAHAAKRAPHQLSGGQQQRVALARALAPAPRLLLLDEPFSSLDVDLREHLSQELRAILKASGTTALFVTHDQAEAFAIGDVVGVMNRGSLEQWDAPYSVYHRPATRFVADFIGHSVFTPGRIVQGEQGPVVLTPVGSLMDAEACALASAFPGGLCDVLLRADDIIHDDLAPVKAQIERKVFRGADFLYTLRLGSGDRLMAHVPSHHDHHVGEWIGIRADVDHVVTFAKQASSTD